MGDSSLSSEFVVVGAGLLGLATARELGRRGRDVVVLERDAVGNDRAGSKGNARIFRFGYDDPLYVSMAMASQPMWRELEAETGRALLSRTGQLSFGPGLESLRAAMSAAGAGFEDLDARETRRRAPSLNASTPAVFEPESGVLAADRCLAALKWSALASGVEIREGSAVTAVIDRGSGVSVESGSVTVECSAAIVCVGPWTRDLVRCSETAFGAAPGLTATLEQVAFLAPLAGHHADTPVFIERSAPWVYGLPTDIGSGPGLLKVAMHFAGPPADPDLTPFEPDPERLSNLAAQTERLLPGYHQEPVATERCLYDTTPDTDFILDRQGRVVLGAGTSGHGFKFGPLLGEILADLATGNPPRFETGRFGSRRPALRT